MACVSVDAACDSAELLQSMQLMESVVVDTVRYPAERDRSLKMSVSVAAHPRGHATGIAVCYSGLLRGFGGERSGALTNHEQYLLRPLAQLFPGELYVAFSMAHTHGQVEHLPARFMRTLATLIRPLVNGSNYMAFLAFGGIEHCGRLIKAAASRRSRSFAFAVRMRYDFLIEPLVAGGLLAKWPIWKHAWQDPSLHLTSSTDIAHSFVAAFASTCHPHGLKVLERKLDQNAWAATVGLQTARPTNAPLRPTRRVLCGWCQRSVRSCGEFLP